MRKEVREYLKTRLLEILPDKDEELRSKILCEVVDFGADSAWAQGWDDCKKYYDISHDEFSDENVYKMPEDENPGIDDHAFPGGLQGAQR